MFFVNTHENGTTPASTSTDKCGPLSIPQIGGWCHVVIHTDDLQDDIQLENPVLPREHRLGPVEHLAHNATAGPDVHVRFVVFVLHHQLRGSGERNRKGAASSAEGKGGAKITSNAGSCGNLDTSSPLAGQATSKYFRVQNWVKSSLVFLGLKHLCHRGQDCVSV